MIGPHVNRYYHLDDTSSKNDSEGGKISITQHIKRSIAEAKSFGYDVNFFQIFISGPQKLKLLLSDEEIIELHEFITKKSDKHSDHKSKKSDKHEDKSKKSDKHSDHESKKSDKHSDHESKKSDKHSDHEDKSDKHEDKSKKYDKHSDREDKSNGIKIIAHSAFAAYPWTGMPYPAIFIKKELKVCRRAGLHGLVVHLGKQDISEVMKNITNLMIKNCPLIYLETPSLKPENSHYVKPKDIGLLFKSIKKIDPELKHFGLCIDSAHLWTSGIDIGNYENTAAWLDEILQQGIPNKNIIIHLNDSKTPKGSGIDQHAMLMEGLIWKSYIDSPKASGLYAFLDFSYKNQIHIILERRIRDELIHDYCLLKSI